MAVVRVFGVLLARRRGVLGRIEGLQHNLGNAPHGGTPIHRRPLDPLERLGFGHLMLALEQTFRAFDELAGLQPVREGRDFLLQRGDLPGRSTATSMAGIKSVMENGFTRYAIAPASRARSTSSRWLNAVSTRTWAMRLPAISDAASIPSRRGILTSMITRSGLRLSACIDGFLAVAGLADDLVAFLPQHLGQVEPDEALRPCDEDTVRLGIVCR